MTAELVAGVAVETVAWDHPDAVRLRAEQQHEIDLRYAQPGRAPETGPDGRPVPDARDQVDPSNVVATLLLRVDGVPAAHAAVRDLSGRADYRGGTHPDGTAEVKRVVVADGFRGRGLARTLMEAVEDAARAAGARHLILETGLMQPESVGLYLRMGYDPVESFGVWSSEPGSRCFGKWLVPTEPPAPDAAPVTRATVELHEVSWDDEDAAALRRAMWGFHEERYPELVQDVAARGGYDVVDAERGRTALATFVATVGGQPAGCATLAPSEAGPGHLTADPLRGIAGLGATRGTGGFEMRSVFVDPSARRTGVGTALVRRVEEEARARGGRALYLGTGIRQPEALRLYVGLGYRPVLPYPPHADADDPLLLFLGRPL